MRLCSQCVHYNMSYHTHTAYPGDTTAVNKCQCDRSWQDPVNGEYRSLECISARSEWACGAEARYWVLEKEDSHD